MLHDYEQYYRDLFRKAFVHSNKHRGWASYYMSYWSRLSCEDADYQVALWGLRAGLIYDETVKIDADLFPQEITALLQMRGWQEKSELLPTRWTCAEIGRFVDSFVPPPEYEATRRWFEAAPSTTVAYAASRVAWLCEAFRRVGFYRILPWLAGKGLQRVGHRLQTWAER